MSEQKVDLQKQLPKRLKKVCEYLEKENLDAILVSQEQNRYYLTGWMGDFESGFVLITPKKFYILTDSRYSEHAIENSVGFEVLEYDSQIAVFIRDLTKKLKIKRIGYESHDLSVFTFTRLQKYNSHLKFIPIAHLVEDIRSIKDKFEILKLKKVIGVADHAFRHILGFVRPGMTEIQVAWEMEKYMREREAEKMAWHPFIVACGPHSSMAHYSAGNAKIKKNDMVLVDYGCVFDGYHSDTTRVFFVGEPTDEQKKIYNLVMEAQKLGESLIKEGKTGATIDKKVRKFLERYTKNFYRHSLGHGVGLQVHEEPRLSINSKNKLQAGNVLTVEPGVYIPGWGGVRLEDMVVVTKNGCEILTKAPKSINEVTL